MACANAVLDVVLEDGFLEGVARKGGSFAQRLAELKDAHPRVIEDVRGEGLLVGLKLRPPVGDFAAAARDARLIVIPAGDNVARLIPPLTVSEEELAEGVRRLDAACRALEAAMPAGAAA